MYKIALLQIGFHMHSALSENSFVLDMVWFGHVYDWLNQRVLTDLTTETI